MENYIQKIQNLVVKFDLFFYDDGYYIVRFQNVKDRDEIFYVGFYIISNRFIVLRIWEFDFNFKEEFLRVLFFWVKFFKLFLNCWEFNCFSRIVSYVGNFLYVDECIVKQIRIFYVRVLIEVDII